MFGIIISYIGTIPTFVGWSFLSASIFCLSKKQIKDTKKRRLLIAFAVFLFVLSFFYFSTTIYIANQNAFKIHFAVSYSIGLVLVSIVAFFGYKLSQKSDNSNLLKNVIFYTYIIARQIYLVNKRLLLVFIQKGSKIAPFFIIVKCL